MKQVAIIPARGGSKRLPRKNILPLGGIPLLQRVVKTCLDSGAFSKVIVSTEDSEIALLAEKAGATIHHRDGALAQDRSTVVEVCLDVLDVEDCDAFCCVYATSALLKQDTLKASSDCFNGCPEASVLMGVSSFNYSPVQALNVDDSGFAEMLYPDFMKIQSQFHPKTRVSNGTFYWARKPSFLKEKSFYSERLKVFDVPESEVCDLDTPADLEKLQLIFSQNEDCLSS